MLAQHGERRTAEVGEKLYEIGDASYPFIAIEEGEVALKDSAGREVVRHGKDGFLGEVNLLSGQTVFLTAEVTKPLRYIAVDREELRRLLYEDGSLSDLVLSAFVERREALQALDGVGLEIVGLREWPDTRRLLEFVGRQRLPYTLTAPVAPGEEAPAAAARRPGRRRRAAANGHERKLPIVKLPGGEVLENPSNGTLLRALGIGLELAPREEVDLLIIGAGPAGLGAAVYGASEGLDTLVIESTVLGGQAGTSRRIENYLGFPAGITGQRAHQPGGLAGAEVPRPPGHALPRPQPRRSAATVTWSRWRTATRWPRGRCCSRRGAEYRRLPVDCLDQYEGVTAFYAAGPHEGQLCGGQRVAVVGGGNSAGQAAVWLARGGALVTLLHRRARPARDHVPVPDRRARPVRGGGSRPLGNLHAGGARRTARGGEADRRAHAAALLPVLLPRRLTVHRLARRDAVARDADGFILTGSDAGVGGLLETSVPGIYAAGDVRAGSLKRCATAVGEGAAVVAFVHDHLAAASMPTA